MTKPHRNPVDVLRERARTGLALTPSDCAEQLAVVADAMHAVAHGMGWVGLCAEDVDGATRAALHTHAVEMHGAARMAETWAKGLMDGQS